MQSRKKIRIHVPEMLVMEILSKLPVKSLTRVRCVSKSWCSSFQTHHFITNHHQNNIKNNNLNILLKRYYRLSQLSTQKGQNFVVEHNIHLPFVEDCSSEPVVSGPCNGILCLHVKHTIHLRYHDDKVAFWNPSTREFKTLPPSSVQRPPSAVSTTFDCFGFGFDSQNNDYKVVRFVTNLMMDDQTRQVELYSLNSDSLKEISVSEIRPYGSPLFNSRVNGVYYWQAIGLDNNYLILSFDMVSEDFSSLPLLPELAQSYFEPLDFKGLLGAIVDRRETVYKCFDLWVMNGSWTKLFSIEYISGVRRRLGFWKIGQFFVENSDNELVLFDPSTRELKNLGIYVFSETMQVIAYVESLVPINGRSEHEERIIRRPAGDASNRN